MKLQGRKSKNVLDRRNVDSSKLTAAQTISMSHDPNPTPTSSQQMQDAVRAPSRSVFTSGRTLDETVDEATRRAKFSSRSRMRSLKNGQ